MRTVMFLDTVTLEEAFQLLVQEIPKLKLEIEEVDISEATGRYLAEDITSEVDIPPYVKSTVDGYGVVAVNTFGASETIPTILTISGECEMGKLPLGDIEDGSCMYIPTGGALPRSCDGVVMIEDSEKYTDTMVGICKPVVAGQNVIPQGEDVKCGALLAKRGQRLSFSSLTALNGIGKKKIKVYKKPTVVILSTGDELQPCGEGLQEGKIYDINSPALKLLSEKLGLEVQYCDMVKDELKSLEEAVKKATDVADMVLLSGGSSAGEKDYSAQSIRNQVDGEVFVHGISVKPGKPTILGRVGRKPVFALPGHPVAAIIVFMELVAPYVRGAISHGYASEDTEKKIFACLTENLHSAPGKTTFQPVKIHRKSREFLENSDGYEAEPIYGKSGNISLLQKADGYIKIASNLEGLEKGDQVAVSLFD